MTDNFFNIHSLELGPMSNFVYLIEDIATKRAAVIDPAWDVAKILELAKQNDLIITDILLTHSHMDHVNGIDDVLNECDAQIHLSHDEARFWNAKALTASLHYGGDNIQFGKTRIEILHTPGHTPGSVCYQLDQHLFTGDTMFVFGCGHCKAGGNPDILFDTLRDMKQYLPANTIIYPGHNYSDRSTITMHEQIQGNPFLHFTKRKDFIKFRQQIHGRIRNTPYHAVTHDQAINMLKKSY